MHHLSIDEQQRSYDRSLVRVPAEVARCQTGYPSMTPSADDSVCYQQLLRTDEVNDGGPY